MLENSEKKVQKIPLKPHGTGILRFQVLNCLVETDSWLSVTDIEKWLRKNKGIRHCRQTLYQALYEINTGFENIELLSRRVWPTRQSVQI